LCEVAGRLERRAPKPAKHGSSRAARPCRILCRLLLALLLLPPVAEPAARLTVHPGGKYRDTQRVEIRLADREKQEVNEIGNEIGLAVYMAKRAVPARHVTSTIRHDTKQHGTMSCSCLVVPCHFGLPCQG
jgi:hypothetical protein